MNLPWKVKRTLPWKGEEHECQKSMVWWNIEGPRWYQWPEAFGMERSPASNIKATRCSRARVIKNIKKNEFHDAGVGKLLAIAQITCKNQAKRDHLLIKCGSSEHWSMGYCCKCELFEPTSEFYMAWICSNY